MVEVARFEDSRDARIAADFLGHHGLSARVLEQPGPLEHHGPSVRGRVEVADENEAAAVALFNRVRLGEFRDDPDCEPINRLVLGGPADGAPRPFRVTPIRIAGWAVIAAFAIPVVIAGLIQRFGSPL